MTSPEEFLNEIAAEVMAQEGVSDANFNEDLVEVQDYLDELIDNAAKAMKSGTTSPGVFAGMIALLGGKPPMEVMVFLAAEVVFQAQRKLVEEEIDGLSGSS